ncbi:hypothetical protein HK414_26585 [Ramlibacter terrae]|uniref:Uncharacterized protein n=1 Tax=Ramlibacter terrae TaxID=2732511 RepID=A0ABX6P5X6_9BURK|nr:hypothetical protein HK414_26585 [Ramlibacter terrae]
MMLVTVAMPAPVPMRVARWGANRLREHAALRARAGAGLPHLWVHWAGVLGSRGGRSVVMSVVLVPGTVLSVR